MKEYAVYKGDELLVMGTAEECAEVLKVKPDYIRWLTTPTARGDWLNGRIRINAQSGILFLKKLWGLSSSVLPLHRQLRSIHRQGEKHDLAVLAR